MSFTQIYLQAQRLRKAASFYAHGFFYFLFNFLASYFFLMYLSKFARLILITRSIILPFNCFESIAFRNLTSDF